MTGGGIWGFIFRRILQGLLVLFLVSVLVFAATQALPGDPARAILGRSATPDSLAALRAQLHLDQSPLQQYWNWFTGLLHGDFGTSLASQTSVSSLLADRVVNSAFLVFCAGIISIPLSIAIGAFSAVRRDKAFDSAPRSSRWCLRRVPEFVVGVLLVVLFATTIFQVLPAITIIPPGGHPWDDMEAIILPTLTLVLAVTPYVVRIMRASMIEVLESDYVEMARLKGLPERVVIWRHALPNCARTDVSGDRDQPGLPGRRRDRGGVRVQLRRHRRRLA